MSKRQHQKSLIKAATRQWTQIFSNTHKSHCSHKALGIVQPEARLKSEDERMLYNAIIAVFNDRPDNLPNETIKALRTALEPLYKRELARIIDDEWSSLSPYGSPKDKWQELFDAGSSEMLDAYLLWLQERFVQSDRVMSEAARYSEQRAATIAISEHSAMKGLSNVLVSLLVNEVNSYVR